MFQFTSIAVDYVEMVNILYHVGESGICNIVVYDGQDTLKICLGMLNNKPNYQIPPQYLFTSPGYNV